MGLYGSLQCTVRVTSSWKLCLHFAEYDVRLLNFGSFLDESDKTPMVSSLFLLYIHNNFWLWQNFHFHESWYLFAYFWDGKAK
jgi:hypothetical protein